MHTYTDPHKLDNRDRITGTIRRLRALAWMGHDPAVIAVKYDAPVPLLTGLCNEPGKGAWRARLERSEFPVDVWFAVATAYEDLSMTFGPSDHYRRKAAAAAWSPPLAWDDEDLDDRDHGRSHKTVKNAERGRHMYDEAAVLRRLNGDHSVHMRPADRLEAVRRLHTQGMGTYGIADALGVFLKQIERDRRELGLEAVGTEAGYMKRSHDPVLFNRAKGVDRERNAARNRRRYAAKRAARDADPLVCCHRARLRVLECERQLQHAAHMLARAEANTATSTESATQSHHVANLRAEVEQAEGRLERFRAALTEHESSHATDEAA